MAFAATEIGEHRDARRVAFEALLLVKEARLNEIAQSAIAHADQGAEPHQRRGDHAEAARQLEQVQRLRPTVRRGHVARRRPRAAVRRDEPEPRCDLASALEVQARERRATGLPQRRNHPRQAQEPQRADQDGEGLQLTPADSSSSHSCQRISHFEIADGLYVSRPTVKTQVASIYDKLSVKTRSRSRRDHRPVPPRSDRRSALKLSSDYRLSHLLACDGAVVRPTERTAARAGAENEKERSACGGELLGHGTD